MYLDKRICKFPPLVSVADYANADPAVVKSGRVKKAVIHAVEKEGSRLDVSGCIFNDYWQRFSFRKSCGNVNSVFVVCQ